MVRRFRRSTSECFFRRTYIYVHTSRRSKTFSRKYIYAYLFAEYVDFVKMSRTTAFGRKLSDRHGAMFTRHFVLFVGGKFEGRPARFRSSPPGPRAPIVYLNQLHTSRTTHSTAAAATVALLTRRTIPAHTPPACPRVCLLDRIDNVTAFAKRIVERTAGSVAR